MGAQQDKRVRVGVIGAGALGLRHCRTLAERVPQAELAAVADCAEAAAKTAAALAPDTTAVTDYRALLADLSITAIVIAVPNDQHAQLAREAAEAGKHVFCEKPLALDLADADSVLAAAAEQGVKLQIGFQRRFDAAHAEARRAIAGGEVGDVELVVATTRDPAPPPAGYLEHSGSFFVDTAIHDYDSVRFLSGLDVTEVFANASRLVLEGDSDAHLDTAVTSLRLENGGLAVVTNSRRTDFGYDVSIDVAGSRGKIVIGEERLSRPQTYTRDTAPDFARSYWQLFGQAYVDELRHFVDCIARDRPPAPSGDDARQALLIALAAERSAGEGRPVAITELV